MCEKFNNGIKLKTTTKDSSLASSNSRTAYSFPGIFSKTKISFYAITRAAFLANDLQLNFGHAFLLLLLSILIVLNNNFINVYAAPHSCALCNGLDMEINAEHAARTNFEEFLFEHQVTRQDAVNALKLLNESFYDGTSKESSCRSVDCSKTVMKYCLGPQFLNDHCWCELGHSDEGLPFIPHICYVGEKKYSPSVGSCFFYEEVKECCCASALARQWRHISEASATIEPRFLLILLMPFLLNFRRSNL